MSARVLNLTFHGIGTPPARVGAQEAKVWIGEDRFTRTLDAVRDRTDVRISFDDGNRSDVEVALPALTERGMTATFFVLAGRLDDPHHLGPADLELLVAAGMTLGSHGMHHRDWRRLTPDELDEELCDARLRLEDLSGARVTEASVPFGSYDRRVLARARRDGAIEHLYTSDGGVAAGDAWLQPRTSLTTEDRPGCPALDVRVPPHDAVVHALKRQVKRWR